MNSLRLPIFAMLAVSLFGATVSHAAPPAAEAFFAEPLFSEASLSPDGNKVAMLVGAKGARMRLAVVDLTTMKAQAVAAFDDHDVRSVRWINDTRVLFDQQPELTGPGRVDAGTGLFAINIDRSGSRILLPSMLSWVNNSDRPESAMRAGSFVVDMPAQASSNHMFVARPQEISRQKIDYFELQRVNTVTGQVADIDAPLHARHWLLDSAGALRAVVTHTEDTTAMLLRQGDGTWKKLSEYKGLIGGGLTPRWVSADGVIYVQAGHQGKNALFVLDELTGKTKGAPVAASKDFDLYPHFITKEGQLLGLRYTVDAEVTQWLDPHMRLQQEAVDKLLPATANRLTPPRHGDSPWLLVQASADVQPTITYAFHRGTGKLTRLGAALPAIDRREMGQTDFVRFKARDGLEIPAYLTLPPNTGTGVEGGKKFPLVVLVHGGPWVRGGHWKFDPEVQFLASRGYAVLQPEFRGSTGFGAKHFEAGFKQWGRAMQDDVADAARWAIAQGHADASRICIAGASYGGYATLMGLARDPDLFKCGVSWLAVTDLALLFDSSWSNLTEEAKTYGMARLLGDPVTDAELLKAASPLENAAKIKQPLLLAYGAWDTRVPLVHGERFRNALKPHNPQMEWVVYSKEGHGWHKAETRIDFWTRVERFLALHIGKP
jgi:dienelactone hydrolase